jgi:hypothetical protein
VGLTIPRDHSTPPYEIAVLPLQFEEGQVNNGEYARRDDALWIDDIAHVA